MCTVSREVRRCFQERFIADREGGKRTWNRAKMGHEAEHVAVNQAHCSVLRVTETCGAFHDFVEHRLKLSRRTGDHPQDIAGRQLPRERLVESTLQ